MNLIKKLWNGDVSLAKTFWGLIGVALLVKLISYVLLRVVLGYQNELVFAIIWFVLIGIVMSFLAVSMWRSSYKYSGPLKWFYVSRICTIMVVGNELVFMQDFWFKLGQ